MQQRQGFTVIEAMTLVATLGVGGALGAAAFEFNGDTQKALQSSTQLRGIHQAQVTFAQSNKRGGQDGFFSGLDSAGNLIDSTAEGRQQILLEENFFLGDYIISPLENLTPWDVDQRDANIPLFAEQHSYAMLSIRDAGRRAEWTETLNSDAVVMGDRNIREAEDPRSVWSEGTGHTRWAGGVTRNDNSTSFETSSVIERTRFGVNPWNETDRLFIADTPEGNDTLFTFKVDAAGNEVATPRRNGEEPPALPKG